MQPIENSLIAGITPARWRSTSYAVKFALNFGVGATVVQLIAPIKTRYSLEMVYAFLGGVVFLLAASAATMLLVSRRVPPIRN
jgi:hypothetical protein